MSMNPNKVIIGKLRQKALRQLEDVYQQRIDAEIAYMLQ